MTHVASLCFIPALLARSCSTCSRRPRSPAHSPHGPRIAMVPVAAIQDHLGRHGPRNHKSARQTEIFIQGVLCSKGGDAPGSPRNPALGQFRISFAAES
jgi:hypothetical protein